MIKMFSTTLYSLYSCMIPYSWKISSTEKRFESVLQRPIGYTKMSILQQVAPPHSKYSHVFAYVNTTHAEVLFVGESRFLSHWQRTWWFSIVKMIHFQLYLTYHRWDHIHLIRHIDSVKFCGTIFNPEITWRLCENHTDCFHPLFDLFYGYTSIDLKCV